jgi:hypothetical protein
MKARLARHILLIEAFENPLRLRFDLVGDDITQRYGDGHHRQVLR